MEESCKSLYSLRKPALKVFVRPGPILDSEGMGAFFGSHFSEKRTFYLLATPKQMLFLTISNKNDFLKTQGTRLGAIVAPTKCLD